MAKELRSVGELHGVDVDPATYVDRPARAGAEALPGLAVAGIDWVAEQRSLELAVVRAPGYRIKAGDTAMLAGYLYADYGNGPVSVTLALDANWLGHKHAPALLDRVRRADRDLSLVLAHPFDPFSVPGAIATLRAILQWSVEAHRRVELLRTDTTAIPAVANGAVLGAIGLRTSTRHAPMPFRAKQAEHFRARQTSPVVLVGRLLCWYRGTVLDTLAPWGGGGLFDCPCPACVRSGTDLSRFNIAVPRVPDSVAADARDHDLHTWVAIADRVLAAPDPAAEFAQLRAAAEHTAADLVDRYSVGLEAAATVSDWV